MLINLIAGLIILTFDLVITYIIFHKLLIKRDRKKWQPFRQHLFNALIRTSYDLTNYLTTFSDGIKARINNLKDSDIMDGEKIDELLNYTYDGYQWYLNSRNEVFNSIQTAAPSISPDISKHFKVIFRCLDSSVSLTSELGYKIYSLKSIVNSEKHQDKKNKLLLEIEKELLTYGIKMSGGFAYYLEEVKYIVESDGFMIVGNEALSKDEVAWREHLEFKFDILKKEINKPKNK